jgi:hypothetical protein
MINPIIIAENGIADKSDKYRAQFIRAHLKQVRRAINDGDDWTGWLQWMRNCFKYGTIGEQWKLIQSERWLNPDFENFLNKEIILKPGSRPTDTN